MSLSDGLRCDVTGIGTVKIKMFNGTVRTLGGMMYVPKMRRNLISQNWLDSTGCRYLVISGAMKITQSCLVLMKGDRYHDGLYHLSGSTLRSDIPLILMGNKVYGRTNVGIGYLLWM